MPDLRVSALALMIVLGGGLGAAPSVAGAGCVTDPRVAVGVAPPPRLPEERQPPIPAYGYVWTPGYWAWNGAVNDYYWAPGLWVAPPSIGLLWTPPYWGWNDGVYVFNAGYWGPTVGFYGGVDYGFGYFGHGYEGGYWNGRTFYYNSRVNNFGANRFNAVYDRAVVDRGGASRASYNGGPGGVRAQPTAEEIAAGRGAHVAATAAQSAHFQSAALNTTSRAGVNHGHPVMAAAGGMAAGALAAHAIARHATASRAAAAHGSMARAGGGARMASRFERGPSHEERGRAGFGRVEPGARMSSGFGHGAFGGGQGGGHAPSFRAEAGRAPGGHAAPSGGHGGEGHGGGGHGGGERRVR